MCHVSMCLQNEGWWPQAQTPAEDTAMTSSSSVRLAANASPSNGNGGAHVHSGGGAHVHSGGGAHVHPGTENNEAVSWSLLLLPHFGGIDKKFHFDG
jgi:hypothetical protein